MLNSFKVFPYTYISYIFACSKSKIPQQKPWNPKWDLKWVFSKICLNIWSTMSVQTFWSKLKGFIFIQALNVFFNLFVLFGLFECVLSDYFFFCHHIFSTRFLMFYPKACLKIWKAMWELFVWKRDMHPIQNIGQTIELSPWSADFSLALEVKFTSIYLYIYLFWQLRATMAQ